MSCDGLIKANREPLKETDKDGPFGKLLIIKYDREDIENDLFCEHYGRGGFPHRHVTCQSLVSSCN